jgi:hypothetical protein
MGRLRAAASARPAAADLCFRLGYASQGRCWANLRKRAPHDFIGGLTFDNAGHLLHAADFYNHGVVAHRRASPPAGASPHCSTIPT